LLGEVAIVWGTAYLCFFTLMSIRQWRMPAALTYLGRISYSIYLLHIFTISPFARRTEAVWLRVLGCLAVSFAVSAASYHLVEKPGIWVGRWIERLFQRRERDAATTANVAATARSPSS
jgi:peptidoglycan/LPS O-acetylase OafA/YrhL